MDLREFGGRLFDDIDGRWESSREEDADVAKKPLIGYEEWGAIEAGYARGGEQ